MERLTDCAQGYCEMYCKKYMLCFEDPEDCTFKDEIKLYDAIKSIEGVVPFERLLELACADKDGRLVVLPCKVVCGTTLWWADSNFHANPIKCEVSSFGIYTGPDGDLQVWMNCYVYGSTPMSKSFRMSSIGKTVFLSREEAEEALAQVGAAHLRERNFAHLSGGEQQLVLIARALAQQAQVLMGPYLKDRFAFMGV